MASVDRPDLKTDAGHDVGVDYAVNGGSFIDKTTQLPIPDSSTHTQFLGSGGSSGGDSSGLGDFLSNLFDGCAIM